MLEQERVCVFVDGENLRHSIVDLFPEEFNPSDYLPKQARWGEFYQNLVEQSAGSSAKLLRTYWYVVQFVDFFPYNLPRYGGDENEGRRLVELLGKHRPYRDELEDAHGEDKYMRANEIRDQVINDENSFRRKFEGWQRIQDGICGKHQAIEFRRAGAIQFNTFTQALGSEKAVDIKLATDLVLLLDIYDTAVIVSGDQDYVPAVQAIKDKGKRVVNVAFEKANGSVPGGARRLNQITDARITLSYEDCKDFLGIDARPPSYQRGQGRY